MTVQSSKRVSTALGAGILFIPYVFAWALLRPGYSTTARKVAFCWLAVFALALALSMGSNKPAPAQAVTPPQAATANPTPAAAREIDPAQERASNKALIAGIQQRLATNREKLKKYYANGSAIEQGSKDIVTLTAIAVSRGMSKVTEDQQQATQAKALAAQVAEQVRQMYASTMEEAFVKSGMDSKVSAVGKSKEKLVVTYALMSQPLIYKLQNELRVPVQAKGFGFKQILYTNGFESDLGESWTVEL